MKEDQIATINDLPVRVDKALTNERLRNLIKIVENEFDNQATLYDAQAKEEKNEYLDAYRKKVNFDKLVENINKKKAELEVAKQALKRTGLDENGTVESYGYYEQDSVGKKKADELNADLSKIDERVKPARSLKNKIIGRLNIADTYGEAMVILRSALGNGIIPTISKQEINKAFQLPAPESK